MTTALTSGTIIRVRATENPKRKGSKAHRHFAAFQDGMTVGAFLALGPWARVELRYCLERGYVALEPAPPAADAPTP